ncbi:MAG: cupin domain-containing protein [Deltaproteobacteria bacterium]|nr:cupin domain-containing protein [bacterium]MCB9487327.1 cupin domain-containing protein [Deltaproteobacteria bacterium]
MSAREYIEHLQLIAHEEGGYFREIYQSEDTMLLSDREGGARPLMNTIYYMLTHESPVGYLHLNKSDITHFFHAGSPLTYHLVWPDGRHETRIMGPDVAGGHLLQMTVPGGVWKATQLVDGEFGLISEAVAPGFDYRDWQIADEELVRREFPQHAAALADVIHKSR